MSAPLHALVIDVRSPGEFAGGHLDGAFNLPLDRLEREITAAVADRDTPVVLCCASGMRSGLALGVLQRLGYRNVHNGGGVGDLALKSGLVLRRG
ncbi:rhodanese-like domain-containing protein [Sphaerotilus hippei]|uniref:Rhodanese-like domain-containing protein n=1 Tax=Sphaerotilus hippei TaxID=744406 RepID=A0A318GYX3_9BURK|nr:rhodanese-like domain-containing protein [Sphaerotilus hippei]PXW92349.1 rhodanese-like domain-containing protein [Sphaerotilus hippei]